MKLSLLLIFSIVVSLTGCNKGYKVVDVIDGDTFIVEPFMPVRIIGIDAPEFDKDSQKFKDDVQFFETTPEQELKMATESKKALQELLLNKKISLKMTKKIDREILENGRTGRTLRFVYCSNIDVGKEMIKNGHARIWDSKTNIKAISHEKDAEYMEEEILAKSLGYGVWQNKDFESKE